MKAGIESLGFNTLNSQTPIVPIFVGDDESTFGFWRALYDNGVYTNPVVTPGVPEGQGLVRTSYMATHTDEQLDRVLEVCESVGRSFGLI